MASEEIPEGMIKFGPDDYRPMEGSAIEVTLLCKCGSKSIVWVQPKDMKGSPTTIQRSECPQCSGRDGHDYEDEEEFVD